MHMNAHSDFDLLLRFPFFGIYSARSVLLDFEALLRNKSVFVDNNAIVYKTVFVENSAILFRFRHKSDNLWILLHKWEIWIMLNNY